MHSFIFLRKFISISIFLIGFSLINTAFAVEDPLPVQIESVTSETNLDAKQDTEKTTQQTIENESYAINHCTLEFGCKPDINSPKSIDNSAKTKYPIVFAHGMAGWGKFKDGFEYWHDIPRQLALQGATSFTTQVSAFNSNAVRGEQLNKQIALILKQTGAEKVNLIGHSQGGLSVRYVLGTHPEWIASVTTVGTPNKGSRTANFVSFTDKITPNFITKPIAYLFGRYGLYEVKKSGSVNTAIYPQDALAGLHDLTTKGAEAFNTKFPIGIPHTACGEGDSVSQGIGLYSWSGNRIYTNWRDVSDLLLGISAVPLLGQDSDGLVAKCSSHFGQVIKDDYKMNHLDEVNQLRGKVSETEINPATLFTQHAVRLKQAGF